MSLFLARQHDQQPTSSTIEMVNDGNKKPKEMVLMIRFPETEEGIRDLLFQRNKLQDRFKERAYEIVEGCEKGGKINYRILKERELLKRCLQTK